jgi:hypothetical protein
MQSTRGQQILNFTKAIEKQKDMKNNDLADIHIVVIVVVVVIIVVVIVIIIIILSFSLPFSSTVCC